MACDGLLCLHRLWHELDVSVLWLCLCFLSCSDLSTCGDFTTPDALL